MKEPNIAPFFVCMYPALCDIARAHGYCLAIHGSVITDMDLVAVPWSDEATNHTILLAAIKEHMEAMEYRELLRQQLPGISDENIGKIVTDQQHEHPAIKPHGRLAYNLYLYHGVKLDISFMPRLTEIVPGPGFAIY